MVDKACGLVSRLCTKCKGVRQLRCACYKARPDPVDAFRLIRLEEKFGFAEDLLDTLNALVARQQEQIAQLRREVDELQRQRAKEPPAHALSLWDELPPHY